MGIRCRITIAIRHISRGRLFDLDRGTGGRKDCLATYRNRRIGELLKELEPTEGRGAGIPKIQRVM